MLRRLPARLFPQFLELDPTVYKLTRLSSITDQLHNSLPLPEGLEPQPYLIVASHHRAFTKKRRERKNSRDRKG